MDLSNKWSFDVRLHQDPHVKKRSANENLTITKSVDCNHADKMHAFSAAKVCNLHKKCHAG